MCNNSRFKPSTTGLIDRDDTKEIFWFHFLAPPWIIQKPQIDEYKLRHLSVCSYTQKERKKNCLLQDKFIIPDPFQDCIVLCRHYQNNFFLKTFFLVFHLFFLMMTSVSIFFLWMLKIINLCFWLFCVEGCNIHQFSRLAWIVYLSPCCFI